MLLVIANENSPASGSHQDQMAFLLHVSEILGSLLFHLTLLTITNLLCSSFLCIKPSESTVKQEEFEIQVQAQAGAGTNIESNTHTEVHDESDREETIETERFPDYDDPFRRASHPFWSQGWYDRKAGVFFGHDGGRYALREMWYPAIKRHLRNSSAATRNAQPSSVPQASGNQESTAGAKSMGGILGL
ncbi:hypothetical protein VMCG_00080 [Cytospora schulzeri]|uniref:Uncharacterized protein n=1 Tax=Cytospora schulzeri TaxID=448051 RepID=A0A423XA29_9PEZI|nr:hypothetical protein VMCG_00080 [Valsa malicola]